MGICTFIDLAASAYFPPAALVDKQKLEVVTAYLSGSLGLKATAKAHEVGVDSLRGWAARYRVTGIAGIQAKRRSEYDTEFNLQVLQVQCSEVR